MHPAGFLLLEQADAEGPCAVRRTCSGHRRAFDRPGPCSIVLGSSACLTVHRDCCEGARGSTIDLMANSSIRYRPGMDLKG